jgi:pimeloyl-ACP methyl ester carboxylesterase
MTTGTSVRSASRDAVILLPGAVLPAPLAYGSLLQALGDAADAVAKELELYAGPEPPPGYSLAGEAAGILRTADAAGFDRFHLVGYSAGGAASLVFAARHPERLLSLALLEPAWAGNTGLDPAEHAVQRELERIMALPPQQLLPAFARAQLRPGIEPPAAPPGPLPPWMAKRPAGLRAITASFGAEELDPGALRRFRRPVYFALGALSHADYYGRMAERLAGVFPDFTLEIFAGRHHFDPPHRMEPERLAASLRALWARADSRQWPFSEKCM